MRYISGGQNKAVVYLKGVAGASFLPTTNLYRILVKIKKSFCVANMAVTHGIGYDCECVIFAQRTNFERTALRLTAL